MESAFIFMNDKACGWTFPGLSRTPADRFPRSAIRRTLGARRVQAVIRNQVLRVTGNCNRHRNGAHCPQVIRPMSGAVAIAFYPACT